MTPFPGLTFLCERVQVCGESLPIRRGRQKSPRGRAVTSALLPQAPPMSPCPPSRSQPWGGVGVPAALSRWQGVADYPQGPAQDLPTEVTASGQRDDRGCLSQRCCLDLVTSGQSPATCAHRRPPLPASCHTCGAWCLVGGQCPLSLDSNSQAADGHLSLMSPTGPLKSTRGGVWHRPFTEEGHHRTSGS